MENGTRRLPPLRGCTFFRPLCGLIVVPPVTTARILKLLEGEIRLCKQSQIGSASDLGSPDGRRWLFKKFLEKGKTTPTEEQAANGHQTKREITMRGAAMITFVLFASWRSHLRSGIIRSHSWALIGFHLGKACFDVKFSRYESRLSPSIRRRPRLLPGQVTTTLEIKPASISL
jgi:hypothetical protein